MKKSGLWLAGLCVFALLLSVVAVKPRRRPTRTSRALGKSRWRLPQVEAEVDKVVAEERLRHSR